MLEKTQQESAHTSAESLIKTNIPLNNKTWFQTGGPAKFFAQPTTVTEFQQALSFAHKNKQEIFVLGEGANILIADAGFDGLVINPHLTNITLSEHLVTAGAGVSMSNLIEFCLDNNLLGLEEFSGIPGTVGGSVYINLHYFEFLLEQFLVSATVIHKTTGEIKKVNTAWFHFGYNTSTLHAQEWYLVDATFKLTPCTDLERAHAQGRRFEIIRYRSARYPNARTCGSFFRNFHTNEVTLTSNGKKMIYVAYYLDKIGVKGQLSVGDAAVSYQHANMLVNNGKATTQDIIDVAKEMQQRVLDNFGIMPQPECQLIGFKKYPLMK